MTARPDRRPCGVLLYDKPAGITSHDAVARVRRALGRGVRVGHAGTLDPFATGLLLILVGPATRIQRFVMGLPKRYEVVAHFGARSSTGDVDGRITQTDVIPEGPLRLPTGTVTQRPPAYSAVKVAGRRAYELARAGDESLLLPERQVEIYRFEQLWEAGARRAFLVECSAGTYVRSLVASLGDAYCEQLRRTRIGPFTVEAADAELIIPLGEALSFLPEVRLDPQSAVRVAHGGAVAGNAVGPVRLTDAEGLVAVGEPDERGESIRPVVGLRAAMSSSG